MKYFMNGTEFNREQVEALIVGTMEGVEYLQEVLDEDQKDGCKRIWHDGYWGNRVTFTEDNKLTITFDKGDSAFAVDMVFDVVEEEKKRIILATKDSTAIKEIENFFKNNGLYDKYDLVSLKDLNYDITLPKKSIAPYINAVNIINAVRKDFPDDLILSEDYGLSIAELMGEPGAFDTNYAGRDNIEDQMDYILYRMKDITNRSARYKIYMILSDPEADNKLGYEDIRGNITLDRKEDSLYPYGGIFELLDGKRLSDIDNEGIPALRDSALHDIFLQ